MGLWIALAVFVCGIVGGGVLAFTRGRTGWKQLKATGRTMSAELDRISAATTEIERHLAAAGASQSRLHEAADRLAKSRARLDVQLEAIGEARGAVRRLFWFLPGR